MFETFTPGRFQMKFILSIFHISSVLYFFIEMFYFAHNVLKLFVRLCHDCSFSQLQDMTGSPQVCDSIKSPAAHISTLFKICGGLSLLV